MIELKHWLQQQAAPPALVKVVLAISDAGQAIARLIAQGGLTGVTEKTSTVNVQGETQMRLDIESHDIAIAQLAASQEVAGVVSEESATAIWLAQTQAPYLVCMDPLDGSSNLAVNGVVGSIFSVLPSPKLAMAADERAFLQAGTQQIAALYVMYGPATLLVLTLGQGTHTFTLNPALNAFVLTASPHAIPAACREFAINASNQRFWQPAIQRYVSECLQGEAGPRGRDFNMRWCASMVMDVHRILTRGGVFLYPKDHKQPTQAGRLRLLYEANPMSLLVTQAGGLSVTSTQAVLELIPESLHQRVPVILGAREEIELITHYHQCSPD